ncbi:MAG: N,N-dimethylformamidase beta subunit family domain-containing protein [Actinomycetota bacterium]
MESSPAVRVVFLVLVLVTVAAFFVTQSLKTEEPLVLRFAVAQPEVFSPNGDRVGDSLPVGFDLSRPAEISFSVIDSEGEEVRRLVDDRPLAGDTKHRFRWNGRDDEGAPVPDATYRLRVVHRQEGRVVDSFKEVRVDTSPPKVALDSAEPGVVDPGDGDVKVRLRYSGPQNANPEFRVYRTEGGPVRIVRRFRGDGTKSGVWDGSVISGDLAVDGNYAFQVRVRDAAGNETLAPRREPTARTAAAGAGTTVRRLTLQGPLGVVDSGTVARLDVGPTPRRYRFAFSRLGARRDIRRDRRRGGALRVRIPSDARTGVYLVRVRARGRRAVWPLAVAGRPPNRAASRARPLVVLPTVTWQGLNDWDSDLDGFGDTLDSARSVPVERPFADRGLPPRFATEFSPLLRFLDREHLAYDLTTDLSLARREGPSLGNAPGVAVAGTSIWLPRTVRDRLRQEVEQNGLKVVTFGRQSLRRTVALVGERLQDASPPRPDDLFGERTQVFRSDPPAPLAAEEDRLGLFEDVDDLFGEFEVFERSVSLPPDARLLTAAGREEGEAAFVGYRLGKGVVIRPGTPRWARELEESRLGEEIPRVTERTWSVLSRRR